MSQDTYELIHNETDGTVRLEANNEIIWTADGGWSRKDDDLLAAILDDANFDRPQKDALRALFGLIPEQIEDPIDESY